METARRNCNQDITQNKKESTVLIATKTDRFGNEVPIRKSEFNNDSTSRSKKSKPLNQYSKDGKIDKYFVDDDKYSLKDLVERERQITADDNNLMYSTMKSKVSFFLLYFLLDSLTISGA